MRDKSTRRAACWFGAGIRVVAGAIGVSCDLHQCKGHQIFGTV